MAYTPELSYEDSCTLRRIAWALGLPMTKAIAAVFDHMGTALDSTKVCAACRDKTKCDVCVFNRNGNNPSET
jgi:recombinational DNA repair protein RecR